jgi:hypothetical protein
MAKTRTIEEQISRLRGYNVIAGFLHLIQAAGLSFVLTLLDNQILYPVTIDYPQGPPGVPIPPERVELFEINIGAGVIGFLLLSALFHFLISSPMFFGRYGNGLKQNRNYFRWVEYSLSSSVMIWLIAQLTGVSDFVLLFTIQPGSASEAEVPGFVYGIIVALFIFFNTFAFNQAFQYKRIGPWTNYLFGEATYITLSLVAKSVLAWQVFSGAVIPAIVS